MIYTDTSLSINKITVCSSGTIYLWVILQTHHCLGPHGHGSVTQSIYIILFFGWFPFLFYFLFFLGFLSFLLYFLFWVSFFSFKRGADPAIDNPDFYNRNLPGYIYIYIFFFFSVVKVRVLLFSLTIRTYNVSLFGVGVLIPIVLHV